MFRSRRRAVVYSQADHARLSGAIAAAWGNDDFPRPPLPFDSFVRGVATHDRGYGELDDDGIFEVPPERWLEIQRRGCAPAGDDVVVDLVVAMHVSRLVSGLRGPEAAAELAALVSLGELRRASGLDEAAVEAADRITDLCDRIAFAYCFEEASSGAVEVVSASGALRGVEYALDGEGGVTLLPWPLGVPWLTGITTAFRSAGYPSELVPVVETLRVSSR
jgi:hypothetical protein